MKHRRNVQGKSRTHPFNKGILILSAIASKLLSVIQCEFQSRVHPWCQISKLSGTPAHGKNVNKSTHYIRIGSDFLWPARDYQFTSFLVSPENSNSLSDASNAIDPHVPRKFSLFFSLLFLYVSFLFRSGIQFLWLTRTKAVCCVLKPGVSAKLTICSGRGQVRYTFGRNRPDLPSRTREDTWFVWVPKQATFRHVRLVEDIVIFLRHQLLRNACVRVCGGCCGLPRVMGWSDQIGLVSIG